MPITRDRLFRHVDMLASLVGERNLRHPSAIQAARAYVRRELTEAGYDVAEQSYEVITRTAVNLEVILPGRRPDVPELIVGAHYDSAIGTPGADDNASAVAALLEVARELKGYAPRRTVRFAFYDTEEMPHFATGEMGSQFHAAACRAAGRHLRGMICLESLGYYGRPRPVGHVPRWASALLRPFGSRHVVAVSNFRSAAFLAAVTWALFRSGWWRTLALAMPSAVDLIHLSDHRGYWEQGYRAVMLTDTAVMRNPNYHQPTDTPDTLDFDLLTRLTRALAGAVRRLSK